MKINNLNVDAEKIGAGLYDIICEKGEEAIVAFGMIPKWIIDLAERLIREKIIAIAAEQQQTTPAELAPYVDEQSIKETVRAISHEVVLAIFATASKRGALRV